MAPITGTKNWWIWLICGTLLGILISILFSKGCIEPKTQTRLIYKSDTVRLTVEKWKHDTIPEPYEVVLPEKVTIYEDTGSTDTLYFRDPVPLNWGLPNPKFYLKFPGAPKLIEGDFMEDSIKLTLFDTSGNIIKRVWPISYTLFDYHYRDDRLLATNRKVPKKSSLKLPEGITTSANIYGFYSPIHGGFTIASDFWVTRKRWSLGTIGELRTYQKYGDIRFGAKYSIK